MLVEVKCNKTHVQLFLPVLYPAIAPCVCTVANEYAESVKTAIEAQLASVANSAHTPD